MDWIQESASKGKALRRQYKLRDIEIFIKDNLPKGIDPDFVLKYIASILPEHLLVNIDIIYIGQFENLISRDIRGVFEDGAIFITNEQDTEMDLIDDLIHEVSHSIEYAYKDIIYGEALFNILKTKGLKPPMALISDINYNKAIDDYLYREVGYPALNQIVTHNSLFVGSYAITSIREYFASGFEAYFLNEKQLVFDLCPALYTILKQLDDLEEQ